MYPTGISFHRINQLVNFSRLRRHFHNSKTQLILRNYSRIWSIQYSLLMVMVHKTTSISFSRLTEVCIMTILFKWGRWRQIICSYLVRSNNSRIKLEVSCTHNSRISIISIISWLVLLTVVKTCWHSPPQTKRMCLAVFLQQISSLLVRSIILIHKQQYSNSFLVTISSKSRSSSSRQQCHQLKEELQMNTTRCLSTTLHQFHPNEPCSTLLSRLQAPKTK